MNKLKTESDHLRTEAEAQRRHAPLRESPFRSEEELLHEFEVHRIELEMQNDELRRTQIALEEARDRYLDLYEFSPDGYFTLNQDGIVTEINLTGARLLGVERSKLLQHRFAPFIAEGNRERWHRHFSTVLKHDNTQICEMELRTGDGTQLFARLDCLRKRNADETFDVRIMLVNITERKFAEEQLHDLAMHLQNVREDEKASIAREIHDELGGTMNAMKIKIHQLTTELSECTKCTSAVKLQEHAESMTQMINSASGITRNIIADLRPTILDDFGLLAAIEWQAGNFHKLTGIDYLVNCIGDKGNLDNLHSIALFRIFQESLTNVTKHSGASRVEIEYHHSDDEVLLIVSDNGWGFSEERAAQSGGFGMLGMKERVKQLGGSIRFDTPSSGGLCLMVNFPLPAPGSRLPAENRNLS